MQKKQPMGICIRSTTHNDSRFHKKCTSKRHSDHKRDNVGFEIGNVTRSTKQYGDQFVIRVKFFSDRAAILHISYEVYVKHIFLTFKNKNSNTYYENYEKDETFDIVLIMKMILFRF